MGWWIWNRRLYFFAICNILVGQPFECDIYLSLREPILPQLCIWTFNSSMKLILSASYSIFYHWGWKKWLLCCIIWIKHIIRNGIIYNITHRCHGDISPETCIISDPRNTNLIDENCFLNARMGSTWSMIRLDKKTMINFIELSIGIPDIW